MSINYQIDCRYCGGHSEYTAYTDYRTGRNIATAGELHIDLDCDIRCPICRHRLNTSETDYRQQVKIVEQL
ncbi:MAG: hypothetical protein II288_00600 [Alistipes sp.]|nr:hypothetical protein [Alistipes sp.]